MTITMSEKGNWLTLNKNNNLFNQVCELRWLRYAKKDETQTD